MKKKLLSLLLLGGLTLAAGAQYQLPNPDFESGWSNVSGKVMTSILSGSNKTGIVPDGWHSFMDCDGANNTLMNYARGLQVEKGEQCPYTTGNNSAKIIARSTVVKVVAQGNMTTGRVYAGSTTATDEGNHNYTDIAEGSKYAQKFIGRPDAMNVWVKYVPARTSPTTEDSARISAILHDKYKYQDPTTDATILSHRIANAELNYAPTDWVQKQIAFKYNKESIGTSEPSFILLTFTTNKTPGKGTAGDAVYVDNIEFIYNSELASLSYNGTSYFDQGVKNYDLSDVVFDVDNLEYTSNGAGANIISSFDEGTGVLTLRIEGDNISEDSSNYNEYTIKIGKKTVSEFTEPLSVTINNQTYVPQNTTIQLEQYNTDNDYSFVLNNFMLGETPVGNIRLDDLQMNEDGIITTSKVIKIEAGDDPAISAEEWLGPMLGDVPIELTAQIIGEKMTAEIEIDMMSTMEQMINVVFAPVETYTDGNALSLNTGLKNVVLDRSFPAGWSTICLPFATTPSAFTWADANENTQKVNVQRFSSVDNNALSFSALGETEQMEANTPYLIYFPLAKSSATYFGTTVADNTPVSVTNGDYTFTGNYEALMNMAGLYGVANAEGEEVQRIMLGGANSKLKATRAYFKTDNQSNVSGMRIRLEGEGDVTAIDGVQVLSGSCDVYNLQGLRVRTAATSLEGLTPGVYVVNGKKVLVK